VLHLAVIATSLKEESKSRQLARLLADHATAQKISVTFLDLRDLDLPMAGPGAGWEHPGTLQLKKAVSQASHVVLAVPIYNYDANAAAKNAVELAGDVFADKVVGFLCAAGGSNSYMSIMGLANSLMLDFRSVIAPRFLYTTYSDWQDGTTLKPGIQQRLEQLLADLGRIHVA